MPQVGFESAIPVFERKKTVLALDRAATVIGRIIIYCCKIFELYSIGNNLRCDFAFWIGLYVQLC
jgi:hypothetical protein